MKRYASILSGPGYFKQLRQLNQDLQSPYEIKLFA